MSETATVEVLTAQVRVLMVGSRQVTLSVFNQLDPVKPAAIMPFGRVRGKLASSERTEVVGADRITGELCRSWIYLDETQGGYPDGSKYFWPLHSNPELAKAVRHELAEWRELPLIVLAGLR